MEIKTMSGLNFKCQYDGRDTSPEAKEQRRKEREQREAERKAKRAARTFGQ